MLEILQLRTTSEEDAEDLSNELVSIGTEIESFADRKEKAQQ